MVDIDTRIAELLNSVVGCAFLVALEESGLTPAGAADRNTALSMAAACADYVHRFNSCHDVVAPGMLHLARGKADRARALIEHPDTAWWFSDIDHYGQSWLSIHGTLDRFIYGTPPNTMAWLKPENPSTGWEIYARSLLATRSRQPCMPHLSSTLMAYEQRTGDYLCQFPLARWSVRFPEQVRVFEVHGPLIGMTCA